MAQIFGQEWLGVYFEAPLDVVSSFSFEAKLGQMKHRRRRRRMPLAQFVKIRSEEENLVGAPTKS